MDLFTMREKNKAEEYRSLQQFVEDVSLMFNNAELYNKVCPLLRLLCGRNPGPVGNCQPLMLLWAFLAARFPCWLLRWPRREGLQGSLQVELCWLHVQPWSVPEPECSRGGAASRSHSLAGTWPRLLCFTHTLNAEACNVLKIYSRFWLAHLLYFRLYYTIPQ